MLRLLRELRADPALALVTALLSLIVLRPLFATPILPFNDLGDHVGAASILTKALLHSGTPGEYYRVQLTPLPYWTAYVVMVAAHGIGGPLFAAKAIVGLIAVATPLGVMRLLIALDKSPRFGICAFLMSWDQNLYWGWISYALGIALVFFALAAMLEMRKRRDVLIASLLSIATALTHILPFGVLLLCGGWIVLLPQHRSRVSRPLRVVPLLAGIAALGPWLLHSLLVGEHPNAQIAAVVPAPIPVPGADLATRICADLSAKIGFECQSFAQKVGSVFVFTLDNLPDETARHVTAAVFVLVVVLPILGAGLVQERTQAESRRFAIVFFLSLVALYLLGPMQVKHPVEHWYTYPRFASPALLLAFTIPTPKLRGGSFAVIAALVLFGAYEVESVTSDQFTTFAPEARSLLQIASEIREGSTVLTLAYEDTVPGIRLRPLQQAHAYVLALRQGYDPYLYDNENVPLVYRPENRLPAPAWDKPGDFRMDLHGVRYDYVLVQGRGHDRIQEGWFDDHFGMKRRQTVGRWTLYERMRR